MLEILKTTLKNFRFYCTFQYNIQRILIELFLDKSRSGKYNQSFKESTITTAKQVVKNIYFIYNSNFKKYSNYAYSN